MSSSDQVVVSKRALIVAVFVIVAAIAAAAVYLGRDAGDSGGSFGDSPTFVERQRQQSEDIADRYGGTGGLSDEERAERVKERELDARLDCIEDGGEWTGYLCRSG